MKGKIVTSIVMGTDVVYDFVNKNPDVYVMSCSKCNDPYTVRKNKNQVSINTTLEVDLTGQACSEAIGSRQFSGTGGQADTTIGTQMSKGGRSFWRSIPQREFSTRKRAKERKSAKSCLN